MTASRISAIARAHCPCGRLSGRGSAATAHRRRCPVYSRSPLVGCASALIRPVRGDLGGALTRSLISSGEPRRVIWL
jgi:hypothetical protein